MPACDFFTVDAVFLKRIYVLFCDEITSVIDWPEVSVLRSRL